MIDQLNAHHHPSPFLHSFPLMLFPLTLIQRLRAFKLVSSLAKMFLQIVSKEHATYINLHAKRAL